MVALRKGAIVVFVVALGYMIIALQAKSSDLRPGSEVEARMPATEMITG